MLLLNMWLNSYQETVLHDKDAQWWGESNVFRVDYPDGKYLCRKEYDDQVESTLLKEYHLLHNHLSSFTTEFNAKFWLNDQYIRILKYEILHLGMDIASTSLMSKKKEVSISTVPYIWGLEFAKIGLSSDAIMRILYDTLKLFSEELVNTYPQFFVQDIFDQLCAVNMKCIIEWDVMRVVVTDLCGRIRQLYEICDETQLELLNILHDRKVS